MPGLICDKRTNAEIQIWNLTFKKYHFGPQKKCNFGFWRKMFFVFWLWFRFKNSRHTTVLLTVKNAILAFLAVNNIFLCVFKNTDQNNICASLVFNAKKGEKYDLQFFLHFLFQNLKMTFVGGQPIFSFLTSFFSFSF